MLILNELKIAGIKALIILVPTYSMAFATDKMVYVVPMLVATGIFANSLIPATEQLAARRSDVDNDSDNDSLDIIN